MRLRGKKNVSVVNHDPDESALLLIQIRKAVPELRKLTDDEVWAELEAELAKLAKQGIKNDSN